MVGLAGVSGLTWFVCIAVCGCSGLVLYFLLVWLVIFGFCYSAWVFCGNAVLFGGLVVGLRIGCLFLVVLLFINCVAP